MAKIVILGAGVMGSALAVPATEAGNEVTLVGSPLDDDIVDALARRDAHPTLEATLPDAIAPVREAELDAAILAAADVVVLGVSSPGIPWAVERLQRADARPAILTLVTKGLVARDGDEARADEAAGRTAPPPLTYADALPAALCATPDGLVGIGGPCIARELALGYPTRVTFASRHRSNAEGLRDLLQTDTYRITTSEDVVGVEACAALKNFLCIGVSAMFTAHRLGDGHAKNPLAALFNQAVLELAQLARWLRGGTDASAANEPAFDLAGMGDLHVTVGGGRNSRLGRHLGDGETLGAALAGPMAGVTVEGVDTGRALAPGFRAACSRGALDAGRLPLTVAILRCIERDAAFALRFEELPG